MNYVFHSPNHPEANGREPRQGEESFMVYLPTDEGGRITVYLGRDEFVKHAATIAAMLHEHDDLAREVIVVADRILAGHA